MNTLDLLAFGSVEVLGRLANASNVTLLASVRKGGEECLAVYKPKRGERPLWDFPDGTLYRRERAAWVVDRALGWGIVPPTVLRDGPLGPGALQLFVEENDDVGVRTLVETHADDLRRMAAFDVLVNNADRKAGHLIVDRNGHLWGVDHGLCFAVEPKLRTVIWAFEGEEVPPPILSDVERFIAERGWSRDVASLLAPREVDALLRRAERFVHTGHFPSPLPGRHHVPWPPW